MLEPKYPVRRIATKLDAFADTLGTWLKADAGRNKHERRTKGQMWQALCAQDYQVGYGRVCAFAHAWKTAQGLAAGWLGGVHPPEAGPHQTVFKPGLLAGGLPRPRTRNAV
jgi:hypothetical protein